MEVDRVISEIQGENGGIKLVPRDQESVLSNSMITEELKYKARRKIFEKTTVIVDPKRKHVEHENSMGQESEITTNGLVDKDGPKNLREAGPVMQARPNK